MFFNAYHSNIKNFIKAQDQQRRRVAVIKKIFYHINIK